LVFRLIGWLSRCLKSEETMNCKQGDLAVIVKSTCGNEGRILTCVRLATMAELAAEGLAWWGAAWLVDATLRDTWGVGVRFYPDSRLRPLRDSDGEDEVLRLVGRPVGTPQAA
jgi:hypothetical protein